MSTHPVAHLDARALKLTAVFTVVAIGAFLGIRKLPLSSGSLHYTDFHAGGKGFLEFCEPGSPQFAPVDAVRSPVRLAIATEGEPRAGGMVGARLTLTTSSGAPVTAADLLVVHTEKLHLLVIDASLDDYHHLHPAPTAVPGEYAFAFNPRSAGRYRVFADFTPRATGRALYAGAELMVAGGGGGEDKAGTKPVLKTWHEVEVGALAFALAASREKLRINEASDLTLRVARKDGAPLVLEEIMGARAHLVAFDEACTGFAHLHPKETVPAEDGDAQQMGFTLQLADPGYYRLWAQVKVGSREVFAPFGLMVEP